MKLEGYGNKSMFAFLRCLWRSYLVKRACANIGDVKQR